MTGTFRLKSSLGHLVEPFSTSGGLWPLGLTPALVLWMVGLVDKAYAGAANIDDSLYFVVARGIAANPLAVFHTGTVSPLVPALAAALAPDVYVATLVQLPLLGLLFVSVRGVALELRSPNPTGLAIAVTASPAIVGWAEMLHFAVACSALTAATLWAYLRSEGFRHRPWLVGLGAGLLLLSRTIAPLYVLALGVAAFLRDRRRWDQRGFVRAVATATLIAEPWWIISGPSAIGWIVAAGFTDPGFAPGQVTLLERFTLFWGRIGGDLSAPTVLILAAMLTARPRAWLLAGVGVALVTLLATTDPGTGFTVPLFVISMLATRWRWTLAAAALMVAANLLVTPPWKGMLESAGWRTGDPGPDAVVAEVRAFVGGGTLAIAREDAWFNSQTYRRVTGVIADVPRAAEWLPDGQDFVVSGRTPANYVPQRDLAQLDSRLPKAGYVLEELIELAPGNQIELWRRVRP